MLFEIVQAVKVGLVIDDIYLHHIRFNGRVYYEKKVRVYDNNFNVTNCFII